MKNKVIAGLIVLSSASVFAYQNELMAWPFSAPVVEEEDSVPVPAQGDIIFDRTDGNTGIFKGYQGVAGHWVSLSALARSAVLSVVNTDSPVTLTADNDIVLADASSGNITINLTSASTSQGKVFTVKMTGVNSILTHKVTIKESTTEITTLNTEGETLKIVSDGSNWQILERRTDTKWTSYSPTFDTSTGITSTSASNLYWRRDGSDLLVRGKFTISGTNGNEAQMALPGDLELDSSIDTHTMLGNFGRSAINAEGDNIVGSGDNDYIGFARQSSATAGLTPVLGSDLGGTISVDFRVQIKGWKH